MSKSFRHPRKPRKPVNILTTSLKTAQKKTTESILLWLSSNIDPAKNVSSDRPNKEKLDSWQIKAVKALSNGNSVVVDAPTTAGKTKVVEKFFEENIHTPGFRAAYTTPVKSLSNDKLRDFRKKFGASNVGIATGDIKDNLNAPIVVATLECYRNSILGIDPDLGRNLVVFDEYHYIQDYSRGSAWEEAIILTPDNCQILLLSASVANYEDFVNWINKIHKTPCVLIKTTKRPVPLIDLVNIESKWILADFISKKTIHKNKRNLDDPPDSKNLAERVTGILDLNLCPCIIYSGRRLNCELIAKALKKELTPLSEDKSILLKEKLLELDRELKVISFIDKKLFKMIIKYGVAYHHSGLAVPAKIAIETLLKEGLLNFCCATMSLSLGVDFSVRSALISDYQRPDERGFPYYTSTEILQMTGRAGRRGKDSHGYSLWPSLDAYMLFGGASRDKCISQLRIGPTTFLGLISRGYNISQIYEFYTQSFRSFLGKKSINKQNIKLLHKHLISIGTLTNKNKLTHYGNIAKHFPQNGGLLLAKLISDGKLSPANLLRYTELMAALSLARFKKPHIENNYIFPFDDIDIETSLESLYPHYLFPELYEVKHRNRNYKLLREFNPNAGNIIKMWVQGVSWDELNSVIITKSFSAGDLMSSIYRTATYLQSLSQINLKEISPLASDLRKEILRPPLLSFLLPDSSTL